MTQAILFDFDGTLADTAPDLALALNLLREEEGLEILEPATVREVASMGARGLLGAGFGITPEDARFIELRDRFLDLYEANLCVNTRLFPGVAELLDAIEQRGMPWGIVTNKATRFTTPLVRALQLDVRAACVVCGDTTSKAKPAPDPLLHAARQIPIAPEACLYVGDDERDVQASRAAGMRVIAAQYGYLSGGDPRRWNTDGIIQSPLEVLDHLG
jgi:phosphoglycolate phosphatase